MNTQFLDLPETDRKLAFDNAALSMQLNAVVLEKDFWVTWLLGLLFSLPHHQEPRFCLCGAGGEAGAWHAD